MYVYKHIRMYSCTLMYSNIDTYKYSNFSSMKRYTVFTCIVKHHDYC